MAEQNLLLEHLMAPVHPGANDEHPQNENRNEKIYNQPYRSKLWRESVRENTEGNGLVKYEALCDLLKHKSMLKFYHDCYNQGKNRNDRFRQKVKEVATGGFVTNVGLEAGIVIWLEDGVCSLEGAQRNGCPIRHGRLETGESPNVVSVVYTACWGHRDDTTQKALRSTTFWVVILDIPAGSKLIEDPRDTLYVDSSQDWPRPVTAGHGLQAPRPAEAHVPEQANAMQEDAPELRVEEMPPLIVPAGVEGNANTNGAAHIRPDNAQHRIHQLHGDEVNAAQPNDVARQGLHEGMEADGEAHDIGEGHGVPQEGRAERVGVREDIQVPDGRAEQPDQAQALQGPGDPNIDLQAPAAASERFALCHESMSAVLDMVNSGVSASTAAVIVVTLMEVCDGPGLIHRGTWELCASAAEIRDNGNPQRMDFSKIPDWLRQIRGVVPSAEEVATLIRRLGLLGACTLAKELTAVSLEALVRDLGVDGAVDFALAFAPPEVLPGNNEAPGHGDGEEEEPAEDYLRVGLATLIEAAMRAADCLNTLSLANIVLLAETAGDPRAPARLVRRLGSHAVSELLNEAVRANTVEFVRACGADMVGNLVEAITLASVVALFQQQRTVATLSQMLRDGASVRRDRVTRLLASEMGPETAIRVWQVLGEWRLRWLLGSVTVSDFAAFVVRIGEVDKVRGFVLLVKNVNSVASFINTLGVAQAAGVVSRDPERVARFINALQSGTRAARFCAKFLADGN